MRKTWLLTAVCFFQIAVNAQSGSIEGVISDSELKIPVSGASVNLNTIKGDNSDIFGRFLLPFVTPGQYELVISHIGYQTEVKQIEVKAAAVNKLNISLQRSQLNLAEIRLNSKKSSSLNTIGAIDIKLRPINTSQDILRIVPGLFIAQHAGGGKAEQIFLRGFDIDHGTDINITVDGMPVNMVSHAHGQGYADMHFVIPETVEKANFDKGPYFANKGNLATAGLYHWKQKIF